MFLVKKEYFEALKSGVKTAELRVGKRWLRIAQRIMRGDLPPIAIFRCGKERIVFRIKRIEIFPTLKAALRSKRWKKLGLNAMSYKSAINEIKKLYRNVKTRPAIMFWLSNDRTSPKNNSSR